MTPHPPLELFRKLIQFVTAILPFFVFVSVFHWKGVTCKSSEKRNDQNVIKSTKVLRQLLRLFYSCRKVKLSGLRHRFVGTK